MRTQPKCIIGLDINPHAIICSRINLILNSYDSQGSLIVDQEGKSLLDRIQFFQSDLLSVCRKWQIPLDLIIGCIPQVLQPEVGNLLELLSHEEYLYSLSNYCGKQGHVEDEFGLGLIAKAIEQSIELLRPNGRLILNLGGRPGLSLLENMMMRRGLSVKRLWQSRTLQDTDTSIDGLVEIENKTQHLFEFFIDPYTQSPIGAKLAQQYVQANGKLYHSINVYDARLRYPNQLKKIFDILNNQRYEEIRKVLDLSITDESIAEEYYTVLSYLLGFIDNLNEIPYGHTAGEERLRTAITSFFNLYYHLNLKSDQIIIAPSINYLINNLITLYKPNRVLADSMMLKTLPNGYKEFQELDCYRVPDDVKLTTEIVSKLNFDLIMISLQQDSNHNIDGIKKLIELANEKNSLLVADISNLLDLSSAPPYIGLLNLLAEEGFNSQHLFITSGFIRNRAFPNLQLAILMTNCSTQTKPLTLAAELTYSRTPLLTQQHYLKLINDLLYFQITDTDQAAIKSNPDLLLNENSYVRNPDALKSFSHPAIIENLRQFNHNSIRMDYGENQLNVPKALKSALVKSFIQSHIKHDTTNILKSYIGSLHEIRFGITASDDHHFSTGLGVADIFAGLIRYLKSKDSTILFPQGGYGYFEATLIYHGIKYSSITTDPTAHFKMTKLTLQQHLDNFEGNFVLYLNAPVVNPTGAIYTNEELNEILLLCNARNCSVILDTIFTGLEYPNEQDRWDINVSWESFQESKHNELIILGGISKEAAAAGLRFGYMLTTGNEQAMSINCNSPHYSVLYAMTYYYQQLVTGLATGVGEIINEYNTLKTTLAARAEMLTKVLEDNGWRVLKPKGGLFLVAKPENLIGLELKQGNSTTVINSTNITDLLFSTTGLAINDSTWTGLPDFCRFVISIKEQQLIEGLKKIRSFYSIL
jgi:methionine S-methyltransferase